MAKSMFDPDAQIEMFSNAAAKQQGEQIKPDELDGFVPWRMNAVQLQAMRRAVKTGAAATTAHDRPDGPALRPA